MNQKFWLDEPSSSINRVGFVMTNECPWYDTEQSDGEVSMMLGFGKHLGALTINDPIIWIEISNLSSVIGISNLTWIISC